MKTILFLLLLAVVAQAQITLQHQVLSVYPPQNATSVPIHDSLVVQFAPDMNILPQSLSDTTFVIQASQSGWHRGVVTYDPQTHAATIKPVKPFFVGELITAVATKKIQYDSAGVVKNIRGFAWQFFGGSTLRTSATTSVQTILPTDGNPAIAQLADFDLDGRLDCAYGTNKHATFYFNEGTGQQFDSTTVAIGGVPAAADFGLRQEISAVIGYFTGSVCTVLPSRQVTIGPPQKMNMVSEYYAVADLDLDGVPEVIGLGGTAQFDLDTLMIYRVTGSTLTLLQAWPTRSISGVCVGDFNNDGALDVFVAAVNGELLFFNDGTGHLSMGRPTVDGGPAPIQAADIDRDGWVDVIGATGNGCAALHNNHDSSFTKIYFNDGLNAVRYGFGMGDFDGDGLIDAVYTPYKHTMQGDSMFVFVARNLGNDLFSLSQKLSLGTEWGQMVDIVTGDMTGDGAVDIALSFFDAQALLVLKNDSTVEPLALVEDAPHHFGSHSLSYCFPNPASGTMRINYWVGSASAVTLRIVNTRGEEVSLVQSGLASAGTNTATFDCGGLTTGTYFVEMLSHREVSHVAFQVLH